MRGGIKAATPKASVHADDVRYSTSLVSTHLMLPRSPSVCGTQRSCNAKAQSLCAAPQFDWEAGIAEDVAEADFGADVSMDHDEQAIEQEEEVEVGEDAAPAAVQQDDFAKRMAAFADAFD